MKKSHKKIASRLFTAVLLLLSFQFVMAQREAVIKEIFPRNETWEHRMLQAMNINPLGSLASYGQLVPSNQLAPLEQAFGRLSLLAAELLATKLTPGYTAPTLIYDISNISELRGQFNGILALLVMIESSKSSNDESVRALKTWSTRLFTSIKIRSAKAVLDQYQQWKSNPCNYNQPGYTKHPNCATPNSYGDMFATMQPPSDIIAKAGLKSVLDKYAELVASGVSVGATGIALISAGMALTSTLGATTATVGSTASYVSLGTAFGGTGGTGAASGGAIGAVGWASVAAAPIAATIFAIIVGTTEGIKVVEAAKVEPMLKLKLGVAMTDYINITNVLSDSNGRTMFLVAFMEAAQKRYQVTPANVDGEVRFYCQAGYISKFKLSYSLNVDKTGYFAENKTFEFSTKDLNVGSEESFTVPAGAKNITIRGTYLAGTWKELFNVKWDKPNYLCYTTYGTIFDAKYKTDCPEVNNMSARPNKLTLTHGGGYTAWFTLTYKRADGVAVKEESKGFTIARTNFYQIPTGATNVQLVIRSATGLLWEPWKEFFNKTWPEPPNECIRIYGTSLHPTWNNECQF